MTSTEQLSEIKDVLQALLYNSETSHTIRSLECAYKDLMKEPCPYEKFGHFKFRDFLLTIPDVVQIVNSEQSNSEVKPVHNEFIQPHVEFMNKKRPYVGFEKKNNTIKSLKNCNKEEREIIMKTQYRRKDEYCSAASKYESKRENVEFECTRIKADGNVTSKLNTERQPNYELKTGPEQLNHIPTFIQENSVSSKPESNSGTIWSDEDDENDCFNDDADDTVDPLRKKFAACLLSAVPKSDGSYNISGIIKSLFPSCAITLPEHKIRRNRKVGDTFYVICNKVCRGNILYCQLKTDETAINRFQNTLKNFYEANAPSFQMEGMVNLLSKNWPCVCYYENEWYRGVVIRQINYFTLKVFLVDFGRKVYVEDKSLYFLGESFANISVYTVQLKLSDTKYSSVFPIAFQQYKCSKKILKELVLVNEKYKIQIKYIDSEYLGVEMWDEKEESINKKLFKYMESITSELIKSCCG